VMPQPFFSDHHSLHCHTRQKPHTKSETASVA
jgi:hypothetical protein